MRLALSALLRPAATSCCRPARRRTESLGRARDRRPSAIARWDAGRRPRSLYDPAKRDPAALPGEVKVLYAGRLDQGEGRRPARRRLPAAHASAIRACTSCSPAADPEAGAPRCATRLGRAPRRPSWAGSIASELARAYASADLFLFCSRTDTYGQVIAEAQASGLPVVAVDEGGPASLIRDGRTGWLCPPDAGDARREPSCQLAASRVPAGAPRRAAALAAVRERELGRRASSSSRPGTTARSARADGASFTPGPRRVAA